MIQNYNFAIDIDKTLTNESAFCVDTLHSQKNGFEESIVKCTLKKGRLNNDKKSKNS